jgi:hypothetical protein
MGGIVQSWWKIIWLLQRNILFNSGFTIAVSVVKWSTTHRFTVMSEVLKSVVLKIQVVWDVMLCCWKSLGLLVNMKTLWSFKVLGTNHPAAQHHILEDLDHLHIFYCGHAHYTAFTVALHAHCNQYDGHISLVDCIAVTGLPPRRT